MKWFATVVMEFIIQLIPHQFAKCSRKYRQNKWFCLIFIYFMWYTMCVLGLWINIYPIISHRTFILGFFFFSDCNNNRIDKKNEKRRGEKKNVWRKQKYATKQQCWLKMYFCHMRKFIENFLLLIFEIIMFS